MNLDALRPYKGYNSIRRTDNVANSKYNSLQVSWNRRFAKGFSFGSAYTLSKSMDDGSAQRDIIPNTYNAHGMWGQSDFDTGINQFQTGTTCGVAAGIDYAGVGHDGSFNCGGQLWVKNGTPTTSMISP